MRYGLSLSAVFLYSAFRNPNSALRTAIFLWITLVNNVNLTRESILSNVPKSNNNLINGGPGNGEDKIA
jgi:hypothetical protein